MVPWQAPTANSDGSPIKGPLTFNLYRGPSASQLVKSHTGLPHTSFTVTAGLTPGHVIFFAVSAVENGVEGKLSNIVSVKVPG
jgi:hypothetical protein